jgi:long-chain acyl-CoA synthetase
MADGDSSGLPPLEDVTHPGGVAALPPAQRSLLSLDNNILASLTVGLLVPLLLSLVISKGKKKDKVRAVTCEVGGEPGLTKRNQRFLSLVETPWEGADTLAVLFEQACRQYKDNKFLGTRGVVKTETETSPDGRSFEKVTYGKYSWLTYGEALPRVENLSSGLVALGHKKGERVAIFAETRAEWLLSLQVILLL